MYVRLIVLPKEVDLKIMPGLDFTDRGLVVKVPWSRAMLPGDIVTCLSVDVRSTQS